MAPAPSRIVVVSDDARFRATTGRVLRENGYHFTALADADELPPLLDDVAAQRAHLVLLAFSAFEPAIALCSSIRARSPVAVIVAGERADEADCVAALDAGADDYIVRPFGNAELLARIRAALRRSSAASGPVEERQPTWFHFEGWRYHARRQELFAPSGAEVSLTPAEHELLLALLCNPQRPIGRARLLELSRQRIGNATDRSVDVLISRLRGKMGGESGPTIRAVRGIGYILAADVEFA